MAALERLLADDAALEMTGTTTWFSGKAACVPYLSAAAYHRGDDGSHRPFAIVVLATTATHLKRISLFTDPALFSHFDLAVTLL